ncbi:hypothetical protein COCMIDRAFT_2294 [Bipolaris oryzae ATCC 44560]|uniref:AB hydrolase-1 domain-containing protein n=1 Tax=Bipolaris oryzae ATCC 44560 TaxID=930090 RepID=W6ZMU0_COCMI|nr:uncharacterized protein COCMIDRAFT_2294 [Bipolaris oryzae ATCC 44560]EUC48839.1 hypothetical protein COCMIDRAFT_2294 [Bipolaris oryzae ATCC 44560]
MDLLHIQSVGLSTNQNEGLKVLREAPTEVPDIDIVAIHDLGAHPDKSWCKNVGTAEEPQWRNWLVEDDMLPAVAPNARIMRYGYLPHWLDPMKMREFIAIVAEKLLIALKQQRKNAPFRPLVFVAHGFGGLIVLKALLVAEEDPEKWPGVFSWNTSLVLFDMPFRGAQGMEQMENLEAWLEYHGHQMMHSDIDYIHDLVDTFSKKRRD